MSQTLEQRLRASRPLLLDGATGSELEARGVRSGLPLWSAWALTDKKDLAILRGIHADYIRAGADLVTANTFRTHIRTLRRADLDHRAAELTRIAVEAVRNAMEETGREVLIAGSVAPVEDCYRPDLVPPDEQLRDEHRRHVEHLYEAGIDVVLIETMNTVREARAALAAARETEMPVLLSFIAGDAEHLLGGEGIAEAVAACEPESPDAFLINCVSVELLEKNIDILRKTTDKPLGAYANVLPKTAAASVLSPREYAAKVRGWIDRYGLRIVGGCCGTTPDHIRAVADVL